MSQTTLIFPAGMPRSLEYLARCQKEQLAVIGASSVVADPARTHYPDWCALPYIHHDDFGVELLKAINMHGIDSIYSPHPVVWDVLHRTLANIAHGVRLVNDSPGNAELDRFRAAKAKAVALGSTPLEVASAAPARQAMSVQQASALYLHAETIPGMCDHEKLRALCEIARSCPPGDVVEIGSWWGKSAFILLQLAQHHGIGKLLCVDPWSDAHLVQGGKDGLVDSVSAQFSAAEALEVFQMNLLPYARGDANFLRQPSVTGAQSYASAREVRTECFGRTAYAGHIALLHVDGNHTFENASADIAAWSPKVAKGGWLVIDDYTWPFGDGPQQAGNNYLFGNAERIATSFVMGGALFIQLAP